MVGLLLPMSNYSFFVTPTLVCPKPSNPKTPGLAQNFHVGVLGTSVLFWSTTWTQEAGKSNNTHHTTLNL